MKISLCSLEKSAVLFGMANRSFFGTRGGAINSSEIIGNEINVSELLAEASSYTRLGSLKRPAEHQILHQLAIIKRVLRRLQRQQGCYLKRQATLIHHVKLVMR